MRDHLTKLRVLVLVLAMSSALHAHGVQDAAISGSTPKLITLSFELQDLPGRDVAGSLWEVSYQWRMADQQDFNQWLANGENPAERVKLGMLLSRQSFTRRNLSHVEGRRFQISIPVRGELLARLRNAEQRRQVVLLDATVRIHDARLGVDVIRKVTPVWGPRFYLDGVARVRMDLTSDGKLRWFTSEVAPWTEEQQDGRRVRPAAP